MMYFVVEGALASVALFYAAKRSARYSRRLGLAWLLLAIASTSYMIGDAIWTVIEVVLGQSDLFPSLAEMRALIFELRPENLITEGLVTAIPGEPNANIEIKEALYRIGLEAIQNTIKHAQASQVEVLLSSSQNTVMLKVRDNGRGFDVTAPREGHYGLISMRERAERCGATFDVESQIGRGTTVRV